MNYRSRLLGVRRDFLLKFSVALVGLHAIFILLSTILMELALHRGAPEQANDIYIDTLAGLSLLYLWSLLRRHKRNAWIVTLGVYIFTLGANTSRVLSHRELST